MSALLNKHAFGLHITDVLIRIAEFVPQGDTFHLIAYGEKNLPEGAVIDGAIADAELVVSSIKEIVAHPNYGQVTTPYVVCSLPESRVFLKAISVPRFGSKNLEEAISWEAQSVLPISSEKASYEIQTLETTEKTVLSLAGATEKTLLQSYIDTVKQAGLIPIALDLESFASTRTIADAELTNHIVLQVHIGKKITNLTIIKSGQIWFSHAIATGDVFLRATHDATDNSLEVQKTITVVANGITSTIKYYEEKLAQNNAHIEKVILTGGASAIPTIASQIGGNLPGMTVMVATPRLTFPQHNAPGMPTSPLLISMGLALRGAYPARWQSDLNFLPDSYTSEIKAVEERRQMMNSMKLLAGISGFICLLMVAALLRAQMSVSEAQQRYDAVLAQVNNHKATNLYPWVKQTNTTFSILKELSVMRVPIRSLIDTIVKAIPNGVVIENLHVADNAESGLSIEIIGTAISRSHILAFRDKLKASTAVTSIQVPFSSFNKETDSKFTITVILDSSKL